MQKTICDRCGAEAGFKEGSDVTVKVNGSVLSQNYDLCVSCTLEHRDFLKGKDKNEQP